MSEPRVNLEVASTSELLSLYGSILVELRRRGVIRSENSPVGDYAEYLAAEALNLTLVANSAIGHDGVDSAGLRYQVKGRRMTPRNRSRQLSAIRGLSGDGNPFDFLVGILFQPDLSIQRAALVPISVVRSRAVRQEHVNGWRLMLTDAVWDVSGVTDLTDAIRVAARGQLGLTRRTNKRSQSCYSSGSSCSLGAPVCAPVMPFDPDPPTK